MTEASGRSSAGAQPPGGSDHHGQSEHDVFVSYSTRDKPVADAIVSRLEQAGIRCWVAPRDVIPGQVFGEAIVEAIGSTRLMVVVVSGGANQSHHVHREVERAVANNVVVIPFRIESVEPSGAMAYYLASEHWLDAITPPIDEHIARLVTIAGSLLESTQPAGTKPERTPPPPPPPTGPAQHGPAVWWRDRPRWLGWTLVVTASAAVLGVAGWILFAFVFSAPTQPKMVPLGKLSTGDCVQTPAPYAKDASSRLRFWSTAIPFPEKMPVVPCSTPHSAEVFFAGNNWPASEKYPGLNATDQKSAQRCNSEFAKYVGVSVDNQSTLNYSYNSPSEEQWMTQSSRHLSCMTYDVTGKEIEGSVKNTGR